MNAVIDYLLKSGLSTADEGMYSKIRQWSDWYSGTDEDFHRMDFYNGVQVVKRKLMTLGMAKTVCQDWASILMNEKVDISLNDETQQPILDEVLSRNRFRVNANHLVELAFALGTGAFVEYVSGGEVLIDYVRAENIYPISWDSRGIKECAFASSFHKGGKEYINLQIHLKNPEGKYVVMNRVLETAENGFTESRLPDGVVDSFYTDSDAPLFQIITPNIINTYDYDSPMGASIFYGAMDVLKEIDSIFDAFRIEIETGRRMVFLSAELFHPDENGNLKNVIGEKESILRWVGSMEDGQAINDYTPDLRFTELKEALQFQLNLLSEKIGMGTNRYEFSGSGVKTATEVISENSDLYQTMRKHQLILRDALKGMVEALKILLGMIGVQIITENLTIDFDDSIITDKNSDRQQYQLEVAAGLMRPEMYRMIVYGEDEKTALENLGDSFSEPKSEQVIL